jgi:hypothetical protein
VAGVRREVVPTGITPAPPPPPAPRPSSPTPSPPGVLVAPTGSLTPRTPRTILASFRRLPAVVQLGAGLLVVLIVFAVAAMGSRSGSTDSATKEACGDYWASVAVALTGSRGPVKSDVQLQDSIVRVVDEAASAPAAVRLPASALLRTFTAATAVGGGTTEFLGFTRALGDMAAACTGAGVPSSP